MPNPRRKTFLKSQDNDNTNSFQTLISFFWKHIQELDMFFLLSTKTIIFQSYIFAYRCLLTRFDKMLPCKITTRWKWHAVIVILPLFVSFLCFSSNANTAPSFSNTKWSSIFKQYIQQLGISQSSLQSSSLFCVCQAKFYRVASFLLLSYKRRTVGLSCLNTQTAMTPLGWWWALLVVLCRVHNIMRCDMRCYLQLRVE